MMNSPQSNNTLFAKNLEYFKTNHPLVYEKITVLDSAISNGLYIQRYILQSDLNQASIFDFQLKNYLYIDDKNYKKTIKKQLSFTHANTFNTLHEYAYALSDEMEVSEDIRHIKEFLTPYTRYINNNLPTSKEKKEFTKINKLIIIGSRTGKYITDILGFYQPSNLLFIEPNPEIFRLSMHNIDYQMLFANIPSVNMSVGDNNLDSSQPYEKFLTNNFTHNYVIKFFLAEPKYSEYLQYFAGVLQMISPLNFDHMRMLNIVKQTVQLIHHKYKFINLLQKKIKIFEKYPILILGAGPSLKYNIEWLEQNHDQFIVVAVASALPRLDKHNIRPDIIISLDAHSKIADQFKVHNQNILKKNILLFSSMSKNSTLALFEKSDIYIFEVLSNIKLDSSMPSLTASNVGEISYALMLIFNAREIYLLGIDAAIDQITGSTHDEVTAIGGVVTYDLNSKHEVKNHKTNIDMLDIVETQGNFIPTVKTTRTFYNAVLGFAKIAELYKKDFQNIYNLSNGAYFKYTIPLLPSKVKKYPCINKNNLFETMKYEFEQNSTDTLTLKEKYNIKQQIQTVDILMQALIEFKKVKNISNINDFESMRINIALVLTEAVVEHKTYLSKIFQTYFQLTEDYINYFFNDRNLKKTKKHIRKIQKIWADEIINILVKYKAIIQQI